MTRRLLVALLLAIVASAVATSQNKLTPTEAKAHIGETATVCGTVVSATYAAKTKGEPTFMNLDKGLPNPAFTIVIWAATARSSASPRRSTRASGSA